MKQLNGVFSGVVTDNLDPENLARVKLRIPRLNVSGQKGDETWARLSTSRTGKNPEACSLPEVGDEVLVAFEAGDFRHAYVIGCLCKGTQVPPETSDTTNILTSRSGVKITLGEQNGQECFIVETPAGQNLTLADGPGSIGISDGNGNSVNFETGGVTVNASAKVTINASQVEISAGMLTVDAGMSKFSGVVQCDTLVANSVVSASYTPGAGNIW